MKKPVRQVILFYFLQGILHNLGHPVTPSFVRGLEIPDYMFGVFFASMSLGMVIGSPIWGVLADRFQKKQFIVSGLILYSIGQIGFGLSHNSTWMIGFRFLSGFGVSSAMTLLATHVVELSNKENRAKHLAYSGALLTLGASLGYGIGGFLATNELVIGLFGTNQLERIFLVQGLGNLIYAAGLYFTFQEVLKPKVEQKIRNRSTTTRIEKKYDWSLIFFFLALVMMTIGSTNLSKYIDVYFDELGYDPGQLGTFVMFSGVVSLFASIVLIKHAAALKKQIVLLIVIHLISAIVVFMVFRSPSFLLMIYTFYMIFVILKTLYQPLEQNYIAQTVSNDSYGFMMGVRQSFVSIGMVIGPFVGGFLYEISPLTLFDSSAYAFLAGIVFLLVHAFLKRKQVIQMTEQSLYQEI